MVSANEEGNLLAVVPIPISGEPYTIFSFISCETLLSIIQGQEETTFDQVIILDCRFKYEFEAGHIDKAINYNMGESSQIWSWIEAKGHKRTMVVFYCEFSAYRSVLAARHFRSKDRENNAEHYPALHFPHLFLLPGGYASFFSTFPESCVPQDYVRMEDTRYKATRELELGKLRLAKRL
jgi:M-phase inducer tyrosine phosphatase